MKLSTKVVAAVLAMIGVTACEQHAPKVDDTYPPVEEAPAQEEKPVVATSEEQAHLVAYLSVVHATLYVARPDRLEEGIHDGDFMIEWAPGMPFAMVWDEGTSQMIQAIVVLMVAENIGCMDPLLGDTRYLEHKNVEEVEEQIHDCQTPGDFGANSSKKVMRYYDYLAGVGNRAGTETFAVVTRTYKYGPPNCSSGYLDANEDRATWTLTVAAWPNP